MAKNSGHTKVNSLNGMAPLVLFLSSYMPLFALIIVRQVFSNHDYLVWWGFCIDGIINLLHYFGVSIVCAFFVGFGLLGTYYTLRNIDAKVDNGYNVMVTEISSMNDEPLAYVATYIIPIMFQNYSDLSDVITLTIIFYIVYRLYIHSKLILVNPILSLKYSIFNIKFQDGNIMRQGILISKDKYIEEGEIAKIYNVGYQLYYGYKR
jgi:hypothetical protein